MKVFSKYTSVGFYLINILSAITAFFLLLLRFEVHYTSTISTINSTSVSQGQWMHSLHKLTLLGADRIFVIRRMTPDCTECFTASSRCYFSLSHSITYSHSVSQASEMLSSSTDFSKREKIIIKWCIAFLYLVSAVQYFKLFMSGIYRLHLKSHQNE